MEHTGLYDHFGNPIKDEVLVLGGYTAIFRQGDVAIKRPLLFNRPERDDLHGSVLHIQHEQKAYRQIGQSDFVLHFFGGNDTSSELELIIGNISTYVSNNQVSKALMLSWFCQTAHALAAVHQRRVLHCAVNARSIFLTSDLSIKLGDFGYACVLPLDKGMESLEEDCSSIYTDIGMLGVTMYELLTGEEIRFDPFIDWISEIATERPQRPKFPSTQGLWLGPIIERCWTKGFRTAGCLAEALECMEADSGPVLPKGTMEKL